MDCGKILNFYDDMTSNMRASIINAQDRFGPVHADRFRKAYSVAEEDYVTERRNNYAPNLDVSDLVD